ncbi:DEKNAAC100029 [Brettanomyces naardenensis]|uniref:1,3-beta-glucanosyltransferase n=1 Tax=Brettanomyces naardenensis TaxID=13370 RepID=A0A448YG07_BRENA|nr:DEKNAAC100029 [Brettanomyces naardenensis]
MTFLKSALQGLLASLLLARAGQAMMPIEVVGKRFVQPSYHVEDDGEVFFIKGIDYQPGGSSAYSDDSKTDVLSDAEACLRDAFSIQQLGANTIRIYTINPAINHDQCMSIFDAAGIYVLVDVNSPLYNESLNRDDPDSSYNYWYMERVFKVIDAFKGYPNLLGFISGNEVINDGPSAKSVPKYLRAVQRDMKQYIANNADRKIPVGYSAADVVSLRAATWEYFNCNIDGDKDDISKADFFGLNSYEWCSGSSDWQSAAYGQVNSTFQDATIPVFFSEYGCNKNSPRTFDEVTDGVFGGLVDTLSGGLVYEYSEEAANYGLVDISSDGDLKMDDDFDNLKARYANASIPDISLQDVSDPAIITCNAKNITALDSSFGANFSLPEVPGGIPQLIQYGVNNSNIGKIVPLQGKATNYTIENSNGSSFSDVSISINPTYSISSLDTTATVSSSASSSSSSKSKGAAIVGAQPASYGTLFAAFTFGALALL